MAYTLKISSINTIPMVVNNRKYERGKYNPIETINFGVPPDWLISMIENKELTEKQQKARRLYLYGVIGLRKDCTHLMQTRLKNSGNRKKWKTIFNNHFVK
jgi:hypothetical protein